VEPTTDVSDASLPFLFSEDYFEADTFPPQLNNFSGFIRTEDLHHIQRGIKETICPRHQGLPPPNLGKSGHGKLKADICRTLMEFDIPVSMAKLCSQVPEDGTATLKQHKMLECTMLLATALCWVTSH
jgi:hypothetical protein